MLKKSSALLFFLPLIPLLQTLDIFITNRLNPTGNGSRISPYNNFITALWKTSQNLSSLSNETELNFLFVTNYILILGSDVNSSNLTNINGISQLFPEISQFKLIRIMPYICYQELLAFVSPPETCNYRTYVNIKTDSFTFLVNTDFYLQNLIFSGNDLNIVYDSNTDSICYFSLEGCCSEELLVVNPYSTKCTLSDLRISRSPTRTFFKSSLFTVTNYKNNTSFKIIHCKFENINGITKSGGFSNLFLSNNVGLSNFTFIVNSTVFRKNYLKDGIIEFSNSPNKFIMMNSSNLMYNYYNLNDKTKGQAFYLLNASLVNMTDCLFVDSYAGIKLSYSVCFMNNVTFNGKNHYSVITNDPDVIILEIETNSNFTGNNLIIKNWNLEFEVTRSLISSFTANNLVINNLQILENNIQNHRIFYLYGSINSISINNLYFFNNTGPGFSVTGGFFIYAYKSTFVTITNSFFSIIIGSGNGGIFYVWDGTFLLSNVTITNLSLNGPSTSLGAVIYSPLNLNFTSHNCVFKNIKGNFGIFRFHEADAIFKDANFLRIETKEFGIIYLNRQITCLIENSTFKDMILGYYGLIFLSTNTSFIAIRNSSFRNVTILTTTAVLLSFICGEGKFEISDSLFENFTSLGKGGILYLSGFNPEANLTNVEIKNIKTFLEAGGFYFENSTINFQNVILEDCSSLGSYGGGFILYKSEGLFINVTIKKTRIDSFWQPGGVFIFSNNNIFKFTNCSFIDNHNKYDQGGVAFIDKLNTLVFENCSFYNNSAFNYRGAIFSLNENNTLLLITSLLDTFYSTNGGIYTISYNTIFVTSCSFLNGHSIKEGGGFYLSWNTTLNITSSFFKNISTGLEGATIFLSIKNQLVLVNTSFLDNIAQVNGGVASFDFENKIQIINCSFYHNKAGVFGGTLSLFSKNTLFLSQSFFQNNYADTEGGTFNLIADNELGFFDCRVEGSNSENGGFIRLRQNNTVLIEKSFFSNCSAEFQGGVFLFYFRNSIDIFNCSFENIFAGYSGGLAQIESENFLNISKSSSYFSQVKMKGGLILLMTKNKVIINEITIEKSSSLEQSGGTFFLSSGNQLFLKNSIIIDTLAYNSGGFLYIYFYNKIIMEGVQIIGANASFGSGGILFGYQENEINMTGCGVSGAISSSSGGSFYFRDGNKLELVKTKLERSMNSRDFGGFMFLLIKNSIWISDCELIDISSSQKEAIFLYITQQNNISLFNCTIHSFSSKSSQLYFSYISSISSNSLIFTNSSFQINYTSHIFELTSTNLTISSINFNKKIDCDIFLSGSNNTIFFLSSVLSPLFRKGLFSVIDSNVSMIKLKINPWLVGKESEIMSKLILFDIENCRLTMLSVNLIVAFKERKTVLVNSIRSNITLKKSSFSGMQGATISSSFIVIDSHILNIQLCLFLLLRCLSSGGVFSFNTTLNSSFNVTRSLFFNNQALNKGGVFFINQMFPTSFYLSHNLISDNQASQGGSIATMNLSFVIIKDSKFRKNKAKRIDPFSSILSKGGALFLESVEGSLNASLNGCSFEGNEAEIGGVLYQKGRLETIFTNLTYIENKAEFYGNELASEAYEISFIDELKNYNGKIYKEILSNVPSGKKMNESLLFLVGIDKFGNLAFKCENLKPENISFNEFGLNETLSNSLQIEEFNGVIALTGPFTRLALPVKKEFTYEIIFNNYTDSPILLSLSFRSCLLGERLNDNFMCVECEAGEYSFNLNFSEISSACSICNDIVPFYCFGGNRLTPKPNYWRSSDLSSHFLKCSGKTSCYGDPRDPNSIGFDYQSIYSTGICAQEYTGIMCDQCAEGYGKANQNTCVLCSNGSYGLSLILQLVIRIVFTLFSVVSAMQMNKAICVDINERDPAKAISSNIIKIFINHVQILALILYLPFKWPENLSFSLSILFSFSPSISESLELGCLLKFFNSNLKPLYFKIICTVLYPFLLVILCLLVLFLCESLKRRKKKEIDDTIAFKYYPFSVLMTIFLLCYSDVVQVLLQLVEYQNFGDEKNSDYRVVRDKSIIYFGEEHQYLLRTLGLPLILIIGILCPFLILGFLLYKRVKNGLNEKMVLFNFGFYFYTFKEKYFFWDILTLLRKICILFVQLYFFSSLENKNLYPITLMETIILISLMLQINIKPYQQKEFHMINSFETFSLFTLFISYYFSIFALFHIISNDDTNFYYLGFSGIFPALANFFLAIQFLRLYYRYNIHKKMQMTLESVSAGLQRIKTFVKSGTKKSIDGSPRNKSENSPKHSSPYNASRASDFGFFNIKKEGLNFVESPHSKKWKNNKINDPLFVLKPIFDKSISKSKSISLNDLELVKKESGQEKLIKKMKKSHKLKKSLIRHILNNYKKIRLWKEITDKNYAILNCIQENGNNFLQNEMMSISQIYKNEAMIQNQNPNISIKKEEGVTHEFIEENFNFYFCTIIKKGTFIKNDIFSIETEFSYIAFHEDSVFVKLQMKFLTNEESTDFSYETVLNPSNLNELIIVRNGEKNMNDDKNSKYVELYIFGVDFKFEPTFAIIKTKVMSKLLYIKFKLPITINLFLLPLNILSSSNFSNEFQESISETIITNIKTDISQFFNKMETILTYNIRFSDKELGGKLSWLNKHEIVIKYLMKIEGESLKIQVGYEEIAENKKTKEEMMELCQSFQSFLKNLIDEYDLYLMIE